MGNRPDWLGDDYNLFENDFTIPCLNCDRKASYITAHEMGGLGIAWCSNGGECERAAEAKYHEIEEEYRDIRDGIEADLGIDDDTDN